jgi:hypothetical protein
MRHNLVRIEDYLFVIGGNYKSDVFPYLVIEKLTTGKYIEWQVDNSNDWDEKNQYQILAHLPLNNAKYLDGIPVLPSLEVNDFEYKLRRTPMSEIQNEFGEDVMYNLGVFIKGYNKAKEKYKWTDDDIKIMYNMSCGHIGLDLLPDKTKNNERFNSFLQSLSSPQIPVAFECEIEISVFGAENTLYIATIEDYVKLKTIINSEGRTECVGKYIYE